MEVLDKAQETFSVYFHAPIRDQKSHTVLRVRVQNGHTVGRDHLCEKRPKIIADPHPVSCLRPPKSIANIIRRFFCLYHDLLDGAFNVKRALVKQKREHLRALLRYAVRLLKDAFPKRLSNEDVDCLIAI